MGPLYHWSPRDRREDIEASGLLPGQVAPTGPVYHGTSGEDEGMGEFRQPGICASEDPVTAWNYSNGVWGLGGTWDLWMFDLDRYDEVHVVPFWGTQPNELRVHNPIHHMRLTWVGERTVE